MSGLRRNNAYFLAVLAAGFAIVSLAVTAPVSASAQTAPPQGGNQMMQGGNQTAPGGNQMMQGGNQTAPGGNKTMPGGSVSPMMGISPKIKGSINVKQAVIDFLNSNLNVTLADAVAAAQSHVNGTAFAAHINVVDGYLVYTVIIGNLSTNTFHIVTIDAGNGNVLASQEIPLDVFSGIHGHGEMMGGQMMMGSPSGSPPMMPMTPTT